MPAGPRRVRALPLVAAGALVVHELRYLLGPSGTAADAGPSHAYISLASFAVALALVGASAAFLLRLRRAARGERVDAGGRSSLARAWIGVTLVLALIFSAQEAVEALLSAGHPAGVAAITAHGGWIAFALAPAVGALITLLLHSARRVLRAAAARRHLRRNAPAARTVALPRGVTVPRLPALACHRAGRAPPGAVAA